MDTEIGISRRAFMRRAAGGAAALTAGRFGFAQEIAKKPPNIILILADDCSAREFGCYGNAANRTPNLDGLARTGVMFKTCWASPICGPSRAMIMTGRYGFRTRWFHNDMKPAQGQQGFNLAEDNLIFAQPLKEAGYATAICGKWQMRGEEKQYGFDEHCMWRAIQGEFEGPIEPEEGNLPGRAARYWHPAVVKNGQQLPTAEEDYGPDIYTDFVIDFAGRHGGRPFLVYYSMPLTHITWDFDLKKMGYVATPELDEQGRKTGRKGEPSLKADVEYVDYLIGRIVKGLEELGIRQNTIILFTCDNGTAGYGKGVTAGERGPLVPLIVNGPGVVQPLGPSDALVDFSDVFPTLVELAGAKLPDGYVLDGHSFVPVLRGGKPSCRDWIFSNYADKRFLRDNRWLLDGNNAFWDCGDNRSDEGYKDVTDSKDPEVLAARKRFEEILQGLPAPAPDDPLMALFAQLRAKKKGQKRKAGQPLQPKSSKKGQSRSPS